MSLKKIRKQLAILLLLSVNLTVCAHEGMWMLGRLNKQTTQSMKELGLKLPADKLYHPNKATLKDAVVSFGGFCSGVVSSTDGLVFTNHHCGFGAIQQHGTVQKDYLKDGFVARSKEEELPNPELYVRFLIRTEDVTQRVVGAVPRKSWGATRRPGIDPVMSAFQEEVIPKILQ